MNIVWTALTTLSVAFLAVANPNAVMTTVVDSAKQGVETCFGLCAVYCLWLGVLDIAEQCGLVRWLAKRSAKLNGWLYGNVQKAALQQISVNFAANLLGVGNAATPSAIAAITILEKDNVALSRAGAMLFVVNACGVQLVPTTVVGLRASLGSAHPADIFLPNLICTFVSVLLGVLLVFLAYGRAKS